MYDCEVLRTAGKLLTTFHPQASTTTSYIKQFSKAMHEKYDGCMFLREQKKGIQFLVNVTLEDILYFNGAIAQFLLYCQMEFFSSYIGRRVLRFETYIFGFYIILYKTNFILRMNVSIRELQENIHQHAT